MVGIIYGIVAWNGVNMICILFIVNAEMKKYIYIYRKYLFQFNYKYINLLLVTKVEILFLIERMALNTYTFSFKRS